MWLPAFKKIRRISSKKKGDSFMGSDLSYEDLSRRNLKDYTFKKLEDKYLNGKSYFILEITPKEESNSYYKNHISWVDKKTYNIIKENSFSINGKLIKEKEFYYKSLDGYELIKKVNVYNPILKHSTIIEFTEIEINSDINESFFYEKNMKRIPKI
jgi:outer membrane lipoprotein-sorting protein